MTEEDNQTTEEDQMEVIDKTEDISAVDMLEGSHREITPGPYATRARPSIPTTAFANEENPIKSND